MEGTTEDLSDNPWEREDPISKCGAAAQEYGFHIFALAIGFCLSGSNDIRHYQLLETDFCQGGIGEPHTALFLVESERRHVHLRRSQAYKSEIIISQTHP